MATSFTMSLLFFLVFANKIEKNVCVILYYLIKLLID